MNHQDPAVAAGKGRGRNRLLRFVTALVAIVFVAASCSGDSDDDASAETTDESPVAVTVTLSTGESGSVTFAQLDAIVEQINADVVFREIMFNEPYSDERIRASAAERYIRLVAVELELERNGLATDEAAWLSFEDLIAGQLERILLSSDTADPAAAARDIIARNPAFMEVQIGTGAGEATYQRDLNGDLAGLIGLATVEVDPAIGTWRPDTLSISTAAPGVTPTFVPSG